MHFFERAGRTTFLLLTAMCVSFFANSRADSDDFADFVENMRKHYRVPGVAVVIVEGDRIAFSKGFGLRRFDRPEIVDLDTRFQLASVSKTFASAGLGVQVDLKKLGWDEEVILRLPAFVLKDLYATRYATPRDLLAHRTGLPAFRGDLLGKLGYSREEILVRIRYLDPATSFRNRAYYSNVGFFAAGALLEKISGHSWEETIRKTLLEPLDMTRSGFADLLDSDNVAAAHAFVDDKLQIIPYDRSIEFVAAGGVVSTPRDMANWALMHLNEGSFRAKSILTSETVKEILLPSMTAEVSFSELPPIDSFSGYSFGMGWDNYHYKGRFVAEKAGALDGVRTVITLIPELKIGIVVLANLNLTVLPEVIRARFLEDRLGEYAKTPENDFNRYQERLDALVALPKTSKSVKLGHPLDRYTGLFTGELYGTFSIVEKEGQLLVEAGPARLQGKLEPRGNDTFLLKWPGIDSGYELVSFCFDENDRVKELQTETLGTFFVGSKDHPGTD